MQVPGVVGARVVVVVGAGVVVVVVVVVVDVVAVHCTGVGPAKFALPYILARMYRPSNSQKNGQTKKTIQDVHSQKGSKLVDKFIFSFWRIRSLDHVWTPHFAYTPKTHFYRSMKRYPQAEHKDSH